MINAIGNGANPAQSLIPQLRPDGASARPLRVPEGAGDDQLSLRERRPQQLLNQQILQGLNGLLKADGFKPIEDLNPSEFTPEKVSDRILSFIDIALKRAEAKGADADELARIREQARAGVEDGYAKARDILEGYGLLQNEEVEQGIAKTYELLQQGLDRMDRGEPLVPVRENPPTAAGVEAFASLGSSEERSLSLQIETRDGDRVTIDLSRYQSSSSSAYLASDERGSVAMRLDKQSAGFSFEYRVSGELDADEEEAIKRLLGEIDGLAEDFFSGQGTGLIDRVLQEGFDSEELAGFDLSMRQVQTSHAALAYQEVGRLANSERPERDARGAEPLSPGRLLQQLRDTLGDFQGSDLFRNPADAFKELLMQRLEQDPRADKVFGRQAGEEVGGIQAFTEKMLSAAGLGQEPPVDS